MGGRAGGRNSRADAGRVRHLSRRRGFDLNDHSAYGQRRNRRLPRAIPWSGGRRIGYCAALVDSAMSSRGRILDTVISRRRQRRGNGTLLPRQALVRDMRRRATRNDTALRRSASRRGEPMLGNP